MWSRKKVKERELSAKMWRGGEEWGRVSSFPADYGSGEHRKLSQWGLEWIPG